LWAAFARLVAFGDSVALAAMVNQASEKMFAEALSHHQAGRLDLAEALYRQVLSQCPEHADALHLLGLIFYARGQRGRAIELISRAIERVPGQGLYYSNLSKVLIDEGRLDDATAAAGQAVALNPNQAGAHLNLGEALSRQKRCKQAEGEFREAMRLRPNWGLAMNSLASVLNEQGNRAEARALCLLAIDADKGLAAEPWVTLGNIERGDGHPSQAAEAYRKALQLRPGYAEAWNNLGVIFDDCAEVEQAINAFSEAIRLRPGFGEAHCNLGRVLRVAGRYPQSEQSLKQAMQYAPERAGEVHFELGNTMHAAGQLDAARAEYEKAIESNPDASAMALNNLGNVLKDQGLIKEALTTYRAALEKNADNHAVASNLPYAIQFDPDATAEVIRDEAVQWARRYGEEGACDARKRRDGDAPDPEKRLRVAYLSADFREHSVGRFVAPLLESHDREAFEVIGYSDAAMEDHLTARMRRGADQWHVTRRLGDEALARRIRDDGVDILVDLSLHMAGNRLKVFARKPAPVQVTYLGYAGTTGLRAMDYRLTDAVLDPPGEHDGGYVERSAYLSSYWYYEPPADAIGAVREPPEKSAPLTFGCLNNFCKTNRLTTEIWSEILKRRPGSRLILHALWGSHRQRTLEEYEARGVARDRIEFVGGQKFDEYLETYNRIDIALDPFPYNGGTTTCDALWMGTAVISLAGDLATRRAGASLLHQVGLDEWVARTPEEYIEIALRVAGDESQRAALRRSLRQRMLGSPLCDRRRLQKELGEVYRTMWRTWCRKSD